MGGRSAGMMGGMGMQMPGRANGYTNALPRAGMPQTGGGLPPFNPGSGGQFPGQGNGVTNDLPQIGDPQTGGGGPVFNPGGQQMPPQAQAGLLGNRPNPFGRWR